MMKKILQFFDLFSLEASMAELAHSAKRLCRICIFVALSVTAAALASPAQAATGFISADEIRPGMRGYALAQFHGTQIERFDVEVVSVYGKRHPGKRFYRRIVALVGGGPLELSRGISTGFSGAPVYFDGRLAGAIDGAAAFSAKNYVSITTIDEMLTLLDAPAIWRNMDNAGGDIYESATAGHYTDAATGLIGAGTPLVFDVNYDLSADFGRNAPEDFSFYRFIHCDNMASAARYALTSGTLAFVPCAGGAVAVDNLAGVGFRAEPQAAFGPGGGGAPSLQTSPPFSYEYFPTGEPFDYAPFEPGAMISIPLVRGDLDIYMYGTLTYVAPDGRFIAFGHPIDGGRGAVSLPVARSHVYTTHTTLEENWSLIASGPVVGTLSYDGLAGGAGFSSPYSDYCPVTVKMRVHDTGRMDAARVEVVRSGRHFREWLAYAAGWALERTADKWGEGTARFTIRIKLPGADEVFVFEDVAYSPADWRAAAVSFLSDAAVRLTASELGELAPESVEIECDLVTAERTARIWNPRFGIGDGKDFKPFKGQKDAEGAIDAVLAPGEHFSVNYNTIHPSGEVREAFVSLAVPGEFPEGKARIQIRGGANRMPVERGLTPQLADIYAREAGALTKHYAPPVARTRADLYAEIMARETGGFVVVEIVSADEKSRGDGGSLPRGHAQVALSQPLDGAPDFVWTEYRGAFGLDVEVKKPQAK